MQTQTIQHVCPEAKVLTTSVFEQVIKTTSRWLPNKLGTNYEPAKKNRIVVVIPKCTVCGKKHEFTLVKE